jgi:hypothetical protein
VTLVGTEVLEEHIAFIIRETRIGELETKLTVTRNRNRLIRNTMYSVLRLLLADKVPISASLVSFIMEGIHSSETSVLTRATAIFIDIEVKPSNLT